MMKKVHSSPRLNRSSQFIVHRFLKKSINREPLTVNQHGQILVVAVIFLGVITIIAASLFDRTTQFLRFGARSVSSEQANSLAEAGLEYTLFKLNKTAGSYTPPAGKTSLGSTGTFMVTLVNVSPTKKTITSTGYVPNDTNPRSKRTIRVDVTLDTETYAFHYAAQTGTGGLIMNQSAKIVGNVYSNGNIVAGNGNQQEITGDAFAVGTIDNGITVSGQRKGGQEPALFPEVNYTKWKTDAEDGGIIDCAVTPSLCTINTNTNIGPKKYVGNLLITNNAIVNMQGVVWVTGNFTMSQGSTTLKLDTNIFGSLNTVLIIDGVADLTQGGQFQSTTATPPGFIMLVTTSVSDQAITLSQSGATAIFYALEGGAELSQTANVTALVANKLTMSNSAQLTYSTGLGSSQFSSGPGAAWIIEKGTYKFIKSP